MPVREGASGTILRVKLAPAAKKSVIGECLLTSAGRALKISVCAQPEDGKANAALCLLLSEKLNCPKTALTLLRGHTARIKEISIGGLSPQDVRQKLGVTPIE